jgi:hypothetical protein
LFYTNGRRIQNLVLYKLSQKEGPCSLQWNKNTGQSCIQMEPGYMTLFYWNAILDIGIFKICFMQMEPGYRTKFYIHWTRIQGLVLFKRNQLQGLFLYKLKPHYRALFYTNRTRIQDIVYANGTRI